MLLFVLGFGIVGMHHVVATVQQHPGSAVAVVDDVRASADIPGASMDVPTPPGSEHGALHMCMAIVSATGALVLLMRLARWVIPAARSEFARRMRRRRRRVDRAIPLSGGRRILTQFCVLRI